MEKKAWYKEGLRFKCTGCGRCCTGPQGCIWITLEGISAIAKHLKISRSECIKKYTRKPTKGDAAHLPNKAAAKNRLLLKEIKKEGSSDYDCIFLTKEGLCSIYNLRPLQCKTYPFWPDIMESSRTWSCEKKHCEGIEHEDAPVIAFKSIEENLSKQSSYENPNNN